MTEFLKKHQSSIIAGIISTCIFLYLLQPILQLLSRLFLFCFSHLSSRYTDRIYTQVAQLTTQDYSFQLLTLVLALMTGTILSSATIYLFVRFRKKPEERKVNEMGVRFRSALSSRQAVVLNFIFAVALTFGLAIVFVGNYTQLSLISSFNQHMRILAPYLDEKTEKQLISEWSLMKSKADYDAVYKKLKVHAQAAGVELPPNKIYSPWSI